MMMMKIIVLAMATIVMRVQRQNTASRCVATTAEATTQEFRELTHAIFLFVVLVVEAAADIFGQHGLFFQKLGNKVLIGCQSSTQKTHSCSIMAHQNVGHEQDLLLLLPDWKFFLRFQRRKLLLHVDLSRGCCRISRKQGPFHHGSVGRMTKPADIRVGFKLIIIVVRSH